MERIGVPHSMKCIATKSTVKLIYKHLKLAKWHSDLFDKLPTTVTVGNLKRMG